ncbi:chemotaxis protein CheW [candidate division WOR-3 bacterium]|nr:chemotaxis protein CheW [candidate division WOR-3 bacterium]
MQYYLSFVINDVSLAVPIEEVQEIARPKSILMKQKTGTRNLIGFFTLRGLRIPLYDLPGHLSLECSDKNEVIIIHYQETMIGMLVDKVLGIVNAHEIIAYPDCIPRQTFLVGIVPQTDSLLQVISLAKLFTRQRMARIQKFMAQQTV